MAWGSGLPSGHPRLIDQIPRFGENLMFPFFGGVPERSKGADCKSVGSAFGGSNPPPSTSRLVDVAGGPVTAVQQNHDDT